MKLQNQSIRMVCFSSIILAASIILDIRSYVTIPYDRYTTIYALFLAGIVLPILLLIYAIRLCDAGTLYGLCATCVALCIISIAVFVFADALAELFQLPVRPGYTSRDPEDIYLVASLLAMAVTATTTLLITKWRRRDEVKDTEKLTHKK
ncbi:hypothetical protein B9G54_02830 [Alloscardovia macacae]|uniref:Uncharacterized protein n=1 Tax=Alloscardovia macacae TaxID=1160091 RepID=A0A1Y2T2G1_9BIFI|nr:hypothetical protein [Alloscardovia macacae]OTA26980.1 hypothetical protein B9G54_02830 [Alloscardovia macacae]OTA30032.1 hypothetical protein B9T39_01320 [Alloscardovia macacae]